jgi:hypothetical protein
MSQAEDYSDLVYNMAGVKRSNPFDRKRQMAYSIMQQGLDTSPVVHPLQGVSRMAQALLGSWMNSRIDSDEKSAVEKQQADVMAAMNETDPQKQIAMLGKSNPDLAARMAGQLAVKKSELQQQQAMLQGGGAQIAQGYGYGAPSGGAQQAGGDDAASRIAGIESGGRYDAVGPVANQQGHRAYGKFQVLEPNIGPWTQEVLGKAMTPQEFLQNPQAQDAVFKAKFGQYAQKYGPEGASRAWFAGEGGMNNPNARDVNGMSVAQYGQKFSGGTPPQQIAQGGNPQVAPGMPPAPSPQGLNAPSVSAPPTYPEMQRSPPPQELVNKHLQIYRTGGYGLGPDAQARARAAIEAENDKLNADRHEAMKAQYARQEKDYDYTRKRTDEQPQQNVKTNRRCASSSTTCRASRTTARPTPCSARPSMHRRSIAPRPT